MKPENVLFGLGEVGEDLLQASERPIRIYRKKSNFGLIAAALALVAGLGYFAVRYVLLPLRPANSVRPYPSPEDVIPHATSGREYDETLQILSAGGVGGEKTDYQTLQQKLNQQLGRGGYEVSFQSHDAAAATLPVFEAKSTESDTQALSLQEAGSYAELICRKLGVTWNDVTVQEGTDRVKVSYEKGLTITVDTRGRAVLDYTQDFAPQPPEHLADNSTQLRVWYLQKFSELLAIGWKDAGTDLTEEAGNPGRETTESEELYLSNEILHAEMEYYTGQALKRLSFDVGFEDHYLPVGDYPIIPYEIAREAAEAGLFYAADADRVRLRDAFRHTHLNELEQAEILPVYRLSGNGSAFLPYYCFWVLNRDGSFTYEPIFVPAVDWRYLSDPPVPETSEQNASLPLLEAHPQLPQDTEEYALQIHLQQVIWPGYPAFRERDEDLGALPAFRQTASASQPLSREQMRALAKACAGRLGLAEAEIEVRDEPAEWDSLAAIVQDGRGMTLTVRPSGNVTVEYEDGAGPKPPKQSDPGTKALKYHYLTLLADLLQVPNLDAAGENPGSESAESEEAFLADTLLGVEMNYRENGELQLLSFNAARTDQLMPVGEYPTISFDDAWSYAKEGRFFTDASNPQRLISILRQIEPVYAEYLYASADPAASDQTLLPYYCFWLPDENTPNLYVPVLVPAVRWEYLRNPPAACPDPTGTSDDPTEAPAETAGDLLPGVVMAGTPSDSDEMLTNGDIRLRIPEAFRDLLYCTTGYRAEGERVGLFQVFELASYQAGKAVNSGWEAGRLCSVYKLHETQPTLQEILSGPMNGITAIGKDADGYWYFLDTPLDLQLIRLNDSGEGDQRAVTEADTQQWEQFQIWVSSLLPAQFREDNGLTAYAPNGAETVGRSLPILDAGDSFHESVLADSLEALGQLPVHLWTADTKFQTLPVFEARQQSFDPTTPFLDDETMQQMIRTIAEQAGFGEVEIRPAVYNLPSNAELPADAASFVGQSGDQMVSITAYGRVTLYFGQQQKDAFRALPETARAQYLDPIYAKTSYVNQYLPLLEIPYKESWELNAESTQAAVNPRYSAGRRTDVGKEMYLAEMLRAVEIVTNDDGSLQSLSYDACFREQYLPVGDYPVISYEEAEALAKSGSYYTDGLLWPGYSFDIRLGTLYHGELIYNTLTPNKLRLPYYRFFAEVLCTPEDAELAGPDAETKTVYLPIYVPAIQAASLRDFPPA